ncbi:MAG TPA: NADH-quinone oxidoreductase subunit J [Cyclobacteriaceae bacterium]
MLFYFFAGIIVLSCFALIITRNVLHSVFLLLLIFLAVSGIYFSVGAGFVGVTQIVVYVGGILIFFVFGIMLTTRSIGSKLIVKSKNLFFGISVGILLFYLVVSLVYRSDYLDQLSLYPTKSDPKELLSHLGISLFTNYLIAFELTAVILLIALIGASFLANKKSGTHYDRD